jgi:sigma-B regulation protein RsbU (phosphoserine phosphatase)
VNAFEGIIEGHALADWLALASAAAGGASLAIVGPDGRILAGSMTNEEVPASFEILLDGRRAGTIVASTGVPGGLLAVLARSVELILIGARDEAERARVGHELAIGRRIQRSLLPRSFPEVEGWRFAAHYEPAREIGGDLYDVFRLRGDGRQIGMLIADVTGKGIPAALLMADVRALLHAAADNADGPADALWRVNRILVDERATSLFVTAVLLAVDVDSGVVSYASAGHEAPLVARAAGGIERLDAAGPILGAFGDATFAEETSVIEAGDAVLLYTDGLTETRDADRGFYGEEPVLATLGAVCGRSAEAIRDSLVENVHAFRGEAEAFDDLTLLVVERLPPPDARRDLGDA